MSKKATAFNEEVFIANMSCFKALLSLHLDACNHVTTRLSDKGIRLKADRVVAAN